MIKKLCMIYPYGGTRLGSIDQILDQFLTISLKEGYWLTKKFQNDIRIIMPYIYNLFVVWFKTHLPEALLLRDGICLFAKDSTWHLHSFTTPYFTFTLLPLEQTTKRVYITAKRRISLNLVKPTVDYQKIKQSLPANLCHYMDATVVSIFNQLVSDKNAANANFHRYKYQFFTNHDCFYVSPIYALDIVEELTYCYKELFLLGLFDNFKVQPNLYNYFVSKLNKKQLTVEQLCSNKNFIK